MDTLSEARRCKAYFWSVEEGPVDLRIDAMLVEIAISCFTHFPDSIGIKKAATIWADCETQRNSEDDPVTEVHSQCTVPSRSLNTRLQMLAAEALMYRMKHRFPGSGPLRVLLVENDGFHQVAKKKNTFKEVFPGPEWVDGHFCGECAEQSFRVRDVADTMHIRVLHFSRAPGSGELFLPNIP